MTTVKRRTAVLVAVSAVSGVMTLFSPTTSAQATPHWGCAGTGTQTLSSPFVYPESLNGPAGTTNLGASSAHSATFTFSLVPPTGGCTTPGPLPSSFHASGQMHGWCGLSFGSGTGHAPHPGRFHWVGVGGTLVFTGEIQGTVIVTPDFAAGETCANHVPGSDRYLVNGSFVGQSCGLVSTPSRSVTTLSLATNTSVNAGPAAIHVSGNSVRAHAAGTSVSFGVVPHGHFSVQASVCA